MKKLWKIGRNVFTVIISLLVIILSLPMVSAEESVIPNDDSGIPDKNLYSYLISEFDENKDGKLQKSEADNIQEVCYTKEFENADKDIYSLKGLNKLQNLSEIVISLTSITTLDGIQGLKLKSLFVYNNKLTDISAVEGMEDTLTTLEVSENQLSTLPNLSKFSKLSYYPYAMYHATTNFTYNKLTYAELYNKLPPHFLDYTNKYGKLLDTWACIQTPDPVFETLKDEKTGLSVEGMIVPESELNVSLTLEEENDNYIENYDVIIKRFYWTLTPETPVKVSIPSKYNDCLLYLVNEEDDTKTLLETKYENGCYIFETSTLGKFILEKKYESVEVGDVLVKGFFDTSKIHINKIEDFSSFDIANAKLAFDITLDNYDESNNIKISINSNERLYVCRIVEDENINLVDVIDSRYVDGKIEFSPKHLGKFVLYSDLTGDVNDDGVVNIVDATLIQRYSTEVMTFNQIELQVADYNNDGKVNVKDCTAIQKSLVIK